MIANLDLGFGEIGATLPSRSPAKRLWILSKVSYDAMGFALAMGKDGPLTEIGWEVYPPGLYDIVQRVSQDYKLPIEITENGCSYGDYPDANGRVADNRRIDYYREHLRELARAIHDGADVPDVLGPLGEGPVALCLGVYPFMPKRRDEPLHHEHRHVHSRSSDATEMVYLELV